MSSRLPGGPQLLLASDLCLTACVCVPVQCCSVEAAVAAATDDSLEVNPVPRPCEMDLVELLIKDKKFIKV